jgi:EF hand
MNKISQACLVVGMWVSTAAFAQSPMDTDGDGFVSQSEFEAAFAKAADERFARLDVNADGQLSADELTAARGRRMGHGTGRGMAQIDTDGDGAWSLAELQAVWPDFDAARFSRLDRNGDGLITADERPMRGRHMWHGPRPDGSEPAPQN